MGVYIKGMEMPQDYAVVVKIFPDGSVGTIPYIQFFKVDLIEGAQAVPVQPHERMIDADNIGLTNFEIILCQEGNPYKNALEMLLKKIENAPTIITADKPKEE